MRAPVAAKHRGLKFSYFPNVSFGIHFQYPPAPRSSTFGTRYITGLHCCYRPIHRTHDSILAGFCCYRPIHRTHDSTRATIRVRKW